MARSIEEIRAELDVRTLEEQLVAAKEGGPAPEDLKLAVREARRYHRTLKNERAPGPGEVRPNTVEAGA